MKEAYGSEEEDSEEEEEEEEEEELDETPATQLTETIMTEDGEESERDSSMERFYAEYEEQMEVWETENFDVEDEATVEEL